MVVEGQSNGHDEKVWKEGSYLCIDGLEINRPGLDGHPSLIEDTLLKTFVYVFGDRAQLANRREPHSVLEKHLL